MLVSTKGIKAYPAKTGAIKNIGVPTKPKHIQAFLGFVQRCKRFIPALAAMALPLYELTLVQLKFHWGEAEGKALESIKEKSVGPLILNLPIFDPEAKFYLCTDASSSAVSDILMQDVDGKTSVLNSAERNYSTCE